MNNGNKNPWSWRLGLALNTILVCYVHIVVEGGPDSLKGDADWPTILNEIPQTVLIVLVAVFMPYFLLHYKRMAKHTAIATGSRVMLITTCLAAVLIFASHSILTKELTLDISWVILWITALYFVLKPEVRRD